MTVEQLGLKGHLTHRGNLRSSRYGWLRLTPMYSVHLVGELLDRDKVGNGRVLDPFCGTGTTALVCAEQGVACDTVDINPFLLWLTTAKCHAYSPADLHAARDASPRVLAAALAAEDGLKWLPPLSNIEKWWEEPMLSALSRAWAEIEALRDELPESSGWLLVLAFLRTAIRTAHVSFGHQSMSFKRNGQLALGNERLSPVAEEWDSAMTTITQAAASPILSQPRGVLGDARNLSGALGSRSYASVITSPPYCNRMSYIRELRPYMYWTGYLADGRAAGELDWLAIGGTWGCATSNVARWTPDGSVEIPYEELPQILAAVAQSSDVLSRYIAKYFHDAMLHVRSLLNVVERGGSIHYIVGNSKFYDVMVPVEQIYAAMFEHIGFEQVSVQTIRKRTSKKELYEFLVSARKP
ncbi:MAG: DNA methyltransferase [Vicinamibacteria bacterium]